MIIALIVLMLSGIAIMGCNHQLTEYFSKYEMFHKIDWGFIGLAFFCFGFIMLDLPLTARRRKQISDQKWLIREETYLIHEKNTDN